MSLSTTAAARQKEIKASMAVVATSTRAPVATADCLAKWFCIDDSQFRSIADSADKNDEIDGLKRAIVADEVPLNPHDIGSRYPLVASRHSSCTLGKG